MRTAMKVIEFLDARKDVCPPDLGREDDERRVLLLEQLARYTRQAAFGYSRTSVRGRARPFRQENPDPGLRRGERACFPARLFISRFLFLPQNTKSPPPPPHWQLQESVEDLQAKDQWLSPAHFFEVGDAVLAKGLAAVAGKDRSAAAAKLVMDAILICFFCTVRRGP